MKTISIYILIILAVVGIGYWLFTASNTEQASMPGEFFESLGQQHLEQGSVDHPEYNTNPPTSGWHWPQAAACGAYDIALPDEQLIHNLEHGSVWISYKNSLADETKALLKDFAQRYDNVIVTARDANDSNIAVAAWTRLLKLEAFDETAILEFIEAHMNKGPELVPCARDMS